MLKSSTGITIILHTTALKKRKKYKFSVDITGKMLVQHIIAAKLIMISKLKSLEMTER